MIPRLILIPLLTLMAAANAASVLAQDKGTVNPKPPPPLANPNDPKIARQRAVRPQGDRRPRCRRACIGFYAQRLPRRRRGSCRSTATTWQVMRLSRNRYWGHPDTGGAARAAGGEGAQGRGWPGHPGRRHVAAARRADADRPCQPSGRARRRHLADADAESCNCRATSARKCRPS